MRSNIIELLIPRSACDDMKHHNLALNADNAINDKV